MELEKVIVTSRIEIPFVWKDTDLGVAEFIIEVGHKKGAVVNFSVFPTQQRNITHYWHVPRISSKDVNIASLNGLENPMVWMIYWCDVHKQMAMRMYVPKGSNLLEIDYNGIYFGKR